MERDEELHEKIDELLDPSEYQSLSASIDKINKFTDILPRSMISGISAVPQYATQEASRKTQIAKITQDKQLLERQASVERETLDKLKDTNSELRKQALSELGMGSDNPQETEDEFKLRNPEAWKKFNDGIKKSEETVKNFDDELQNTNKALERLSADKLKNLSKLFSDVADALKAFVSEIRNIQQQFGIDAGQAASLAGRDFSQSIGSMFGALTGQEAFVTREQIQQGRSAFQGEFGGLISPDEARAVAQRSAQEGITAQQQAMARRVFITESRGDVGGAERREAQFLEQFKNANLTAKDAMDAIAKNSELLYRAGDRFRDSITKAAIEAKKIGVDLSSIERFGDNLINNFEGFLEGQAELGAMGFGFDTSRLSEIAAGGDPGALMQELQSQLASTGKNLDTLSRPERLAIESAFGMSIGDMKKLTGGSDSGKTMEDLQSTANGLLEKAVNFLSGFGPILGGVSAILAGAHTLLLTSIAASTGATALAISGLTGIGAGLASIGTALLPLVGIATGIAALVTAINFLASNREQQAKKDFEEGNVVKGTINQTGSSALKGALPGIAMATAGALMVGTGIGAPLGAGLIAASLPTIQGGMAVGGAIGLKKSYDAMHADDMISKPGYGERVLLHQNQPPIALNNQDTVVAYADDLISSESGVKLLSKGDAAPSLDISPLEAKLDVVVKTIQQMAQQTATTNQQVASALSVRRNVYLNGNQVGYEMAENETSAAIAAPFRVARTNRG
jgi:hypothetical protein